MSAEWAEQPATPDNRDAIPGKTLAAQREAMGWSVEQVADQLKLAVRQVVALEAGDYASLPAPAVVRGFVRAYAKVVKLDPAPLVAMIALETPAPSDATATTVRRDKQAAFSEVRFPTHGKRARLPAGPIALAALVLLAVAGAWQFELIPSGLLQGGGPASAAANSQASVTALPAPVTGAAGEGQIETTLVKPGAELAPLLNPSVPLISVPPAAGAGPVAAPADSAAPAAAALAGNALVLEVREDSWIEVRRASGGNLLKRLVRGGTTETLEITEPVTLVVGNPGAVTASLRGAPLALPAAAGTTISRVNIK